mgnify:CR=1 FL=1
MVVGAGHAGCEAALAAARLNQKTLLLTLNLDGVALMACNPAIGGTSKGHLVREIDALGGEMGINTDATFIQIKMLNTGKGPAVHSLRAQADKKEYQRVMKSTLENTDNLTLSQAEVTEIVEKNGRVAAVKTTTGAVYQTQTAILATGVYLKSKIIIGEWMYSGGPSGLFPASYLSRGLTDLGFSLRRFKTGTPARVDKRSIDFSKTTPQYGDEEIIPFSFMSGEIRREQVPCYLTYTNEKTRDIIRANMGRSPLYSGKIEGTGPRYCPSIEDKIVKFPDKERHQLFLEPESLQTNEIYVQGMSSSLPEEVQVAMYRTVPGLENVQFMRPAYAIEYDCIDSTVLKRSLESKEIGGLFFAGQINGTSGYEEAGAQGVVAGLNAVQYIRGEEPLVLGRADGYAGVLIDDLVTKGTNEPYRMMTSRAEYRLLLRQDNADARLTEKGRKLGLVSDARYDRFMKKQEGIERIVAEMETRLVKADRVNGYLTEQGSEPLTANVKYADILKRPNVYLDDLIAFDEEFLRLDKEVMKCAETNVKYAGYIKKQENQVNQQKAMEEKRLPADVDYSRIKGIRIEAAQKLNAIRPESLGQASRISGVSPADISVLVIYFKQREQSR